MELEAERGEMIMEKKENRRLQQRIPKSKGRGKGKEIPGIEIIEAYKPMTTALGPRMTVSPSRCYRFFLYVFLQDCSFRLYLLFIIRSWIVWDGADSR